uniref:Long chain base biosynthesis protein 1-like isoform X2 n=1 Tax=Tanacetum cinerariifolium TaxID=118510 RepID=A0A699HF90_TANCI|nr:long chain base biosynthesis protein 1-like isoform X2 [Tanacetum cinerariifolium]
MNGTPGLDRTRDSDNPGNRQKEMGRILESANSMVENADTAKYHDPTSLFKHFLIACMHPNANLRPVEDAFATRKKWQAKYDKTDLINLKVMQFRSPASVMVKPKAYDAVDNLLDCGLSIVASVCLLLQTHLMFVDKYFYHFGTAISNNSNATIWVSTKMVPSTVVDVIRESPENKLHVLLLEIRIMNVVARPLNVLKEHSTFVVTSKMSSLDKCKLLVGIRWFVSAAQIESDLQKAYESLKIIAASVLTGLVAFCLLRFINCSSLRLAIPLQINFSRPNVKMIVDSIKNGPYVRRMIATPGEPDLPIPVPESFHKQTEEELTETDIKRMDADDQAIQTILLGLPEDVYAAVDSCETAKKYGNVSDK